MWKNSKREAYVMKNRKGKTISVFFCFRSLVESDRDGRVEVGFELLVARYCVLCSRGIYVYCVVSR